MGLEDTYNILGYLIFIMICVFITLVIGKSLHKNGQVFLETLFIEDIDAMTTVNNILLIGYYLLNIGFALFKITNWESIETLSGLIYNVSYHLAIILLILASIHFTNLLAFYITARIKNKFI